VATSTGHESGVAIMDESPLADKLDMKAIEKEVLDGVIKAVSARNAKVEVAAKEKADAETLEAEKKAEVVKEEKAAEKGDTSNSLKKMVEDIKNQKGEEAKKLEKEDDKEAADEAVEDMMHKAAANSKSAAELIDASKTGVSVSDVKVEQEATMAAFNPDEEKKMLTSEDDMVHNQVTSFKVAENAKKHMESEVGTAAEAVAAGVQSKYEKEALKTAMKKELAPAIAAAAKKVGVDLASGKYDAADFQSPLETPLEKSEIAKNLLLVKKDESKVKKLKAQLKDEKDTFKKKELRKAIRGFKIKEDEARETAKQIVEKPGGEQRTNTEEEDELKIQMSKAKLAVLNQQVEKDADKAKEKIAKGVKAKKWADKMMRKSQKFAKKERRDVIHQARKLKRETRFKAIETERKAARARERKEEEAAQMRDEAEEIARDTGVPAIARGKPGYGIMSRAGRNQEIEKAQKKDAAAAAAAAASERSVKANTIVDDSVHVILHKDEPPGGTR